MKSSNHRIRRIVASRYPLVRGVVANYVRRERDIHVVGQVEGPEAEAPLSSSISSDVVLLDGLCPDVHSDEFVARLKEVLPNQIVLLTLTRELSPELVGLKQRIPRTWGHVATCEPPEVLVETVRKVAAGEPREPHENDGGVCQVNQRELQKLLTETERTILRLVAHGLSNKAIADRLGVTNRSVENHRLRLCRKLGIQSSAALTRYAVRAGFISP